MSKDREFDRYLDHLDTEDQRALNAYMDNLNLEDNQELDDYLEHIEEQMNAQQNRQFTDEVVNEMNGFAVNNPYESSQEYTQDNIGAQPQEYMQGNMSEQPQEYGNISEPVQEYVQGNQGGLSSFIELEPEIESFQDYTTARMKPVNPEAVGQNTVTHDNDKEEPTVIQEDIAEPLQFSLLDEEYEPTVDTIRYKDDVEAEIVKPKNNYSDDVLYIDTVKKKSKAPVVFAVILILILLGGGVYATYYFTDGFTDFAFLKKEPTTELTTEVITTEATTEEATTEEPPKPYATVDYVLHDPHVTDDTIDYKSNPYSLRFSEEDWPIQRDDNGEQRDATQEELYPVITLEAHEGSLNSTNPDPSNLAETQQMTSRYMVLVDMSDDSIVAKRDSDIIVNPASMTKILTVLTAVDMIEDLDDTYEVPGEAIQYSMDHGCSAVGFLVGEKITVRDMIYGTIVCSGADAAVTLADYCCGSQDAFVEKMNEKVDELGLSETAHFTNVVGVYDENLHCTMEDIAVILATAMQNDLLKDVLNTRIYQTTPDPSFLPEDMRKELGIVLDDETGTADVTTEAATEQDNDSSEGQNDNSDESTDASDGTSGENTVAASEEASSEQTSEEQSTDTTATEEGTTEEIDPGILLIGKDGIQISNWFMRRIEDKDTGGEVLGAKTGFVNASGFCCASYYRSNSGKEYICVTGDTYSSWRCIYDHVGIYRSLTK